MPTSLPLSSAISPEFGELPLASTLALLPVGATEQHGPNLGMGVDYRIAEEIAALVAGRMENHAVVCPSLPFGLSDHHMGFPGTVTIGAEAFQAVLMDVVRSLGAHGIRHFLFINGHMGNQNILAVLTGKIHHQLGYRAGSAFWMAQARDVAQEHAVTTRWGHACEIETSVAMAVTPELVRDDALEAGDLIEAYGAYEDNYQPHAVQTPKPFSERTRNGAFGDATHADGAIGREIVDTAVSRIAAFADDFVTSRRM